MESAQLNASHNSDERLIVPNIISRAAETFRNGLLFFILGRAKISQSCANQPPFLLLNRTFQIGERERERETRSRKSHGKPEQST